MFFPTLNEIKTQRKTVSVFGGYNHNLRIRDNEFYDMKNMSADNYPLISTRGGRCNFGTIYCDSVAASSEICFLSGKTLYWYPDGEHTMQHIVIDQISYSNKEHKLIPFGSYIIIMPEGYYVNRNDVQDRGSIFNVYYSQDHQDTGPTFTLCESDGTEITVSKAGKTPPASPAGGDYWIDTSGGLENVVLKVWSENLSTWMPVANTYVKISAIDIGVGFKAGDGVFLGNIKYKTLATTAGDRPVLVSVPNSNSIVVRGLVSNSPQNQNSNITVSRKMPPKIQHIVECGNRLWGCCFRETGNGSVINEIYACKLGDFTNWYCFEGLSTDSYVASVGSDGQFTGASSYNGYPVFFKERFIHKVYGNYPSNYQIQTQECDGVQVGCGDSIASVNGILIYKGVNGLVSYDGSFPRVISDVLGNDFYDNAHAGVINRKYYLSMRNISTDSYELFCYDTRYGLWSKEDDTDAFNFIFAGGYLYYLDGGEKIVNTVSEGHLIFEKEEYKIRMITSVGYEREPTYEIDENGKSTIEWMLETGIIGLETDNNKYIGRMLIKAAIDEGAYADVFIQYDSNGKWERVTRVKAKNLRTFNIPIRPRRCDHFRIKLEGEGDVKIFSITKVIEEGSDTYAI